MKDNLGARDSTSGYSSKEIQNTNSKEYVHHCVHCSVIDNSQDVEAAQGPVNRQLGKNEILFGHKKELNFYPFVTAWMEGIMLSETRQRMPNTI